MQQHDMKPKILYVDDEEENLMVFKSSFRRNYNVFTALSVSAAQELLKDTTFDIVISDQRMPGITGVEFLKSLPDEPANIRMLLTGYSDMEAVIEAVNDGKIYRYITKPWERDELQQTIDGALELLNDLVNKNKQLFLLALEKKTLEDSLQSEHNKDGESHIRLELINKDKEILLFKKQVEEAYRNIHLLSEIGQEIIANLTVDGIVESAYENVNALMDANAFAIGIYDESSDRIMMTFMEKGVKMPVGAVYLNEDKPAAWTFKSNKEFFSNDYINDFSKYSKSKLSAVVGELPESMIYLPLETKEKVIGVITVQSFKKEAYTVYHLNMLRNIAIYVATAIENAKSYSLIEHQKAEIEHKNIELEQKVQQRTEQLQQKNDELEGTYSNVKLLSEIGQQITSTLSLEKIIETVYENVNSLMDATIFGIGVLNPHDNRLDFPGSMEKGIKLPFWFANLDDENRLAIWCFKNQKEIIIDDYQTEYNKYIKSIQKPKAGEDPDSILYLPLITNEGTIGVITVQSFKKHIYNQYHIDILRSLASYITIAIQNSTSYRKMTQAFEDLKAAQMKLVEAEKMASLGVLTAGVAHEINNPVNFISAGITSLRNNYKDVEALLSLYLAYDPKNSTDAEWDQIQQLRQQIDPDELLPEIEILFKSIRSGASRTSEIVKGLRNFSRLDENEMKRARIEEGIDNTLVILNNKLKNRVKVIKEYSDLPEIMCYPGQLNQVFMNLLHNASDAIEGEGTITIKTSKDGDQIKISISDSGKGIPEETRSRIFEPFFTTKAVGKGTGLGLSIAYGIIEKHKGTIEVKSIERKGLSAEASAQAGTEFTITLPLNKF